MQQGFLTLAPPLPQTSVPVITCFASGQLADLSLLSVQLAQHLVIVSVSWFPAFRGYDVFDVHAAT